MAKTCFMVLGLVLLLAASVWSGTFRDDFEDGDTIGWDALGEWLVENGELVGEDREAASGSYTTFTIGELGWRNYTVEADAKLIVSLAYPPAAGIFVRAQQEPGHLHSFGFNQGSCGHTFEPVPVPGFMELRGFEAGTWYHLKVVAGGDHFEFNINDGLIGELDHQSYPTGRVGLYVFNMKASFDNVVIVGEDIPENGSGTSSVEYRGRLTTKWAAIKCCQASYRRGD